MSEGWWHMTRRAAHGASGIASGRSRAEAGCGNNDGCTTEDAATVVNGELGSNIEGRGMD